MLFSEINKKLRCMVLNEITYEANSNSIDVNLQIFRRITK